MTAPGKWDTPKYCKYCGCELEKPLRSACDPCKKENYRTYHREWERRNPVLQQRRIDNPRRRRTSDGCMDCGSVEVRPGTSYCRPCGTLRSKASYEKNYQKHRAAQTFKKYGITQEVFDSLLKEQAGRCAICSTPLIFHKKRGAVLPDGYRIGVVDHCHTVGDARGLLCTPCNTGIGLLRDDPAILTSAIEYLCHTGEE